MGLLKQKYRMLIILKLYDKCMEVHYSILFTFVYLNTIIIKSFLKLWVKC